MRAFRGVTLRAQSDHHHASLLNLARSAVSFHGRFDLGVVGRDLFVDVSMECCELGGLGVGFRRIDSRCGQVDEIDR